MAVQKFIKRVLIPGGTVVAIPAVIPLLYAEEGPGRGSGEHHLKFINENVDPPKQVQVHGHGHGHGLGQPHAHHATNIDTVPATASVYVSPQDLPIYDGPQLPASGNSTCHHDSIEQDPSQLQQGVTIVRQTVMSSVENLKVEENKDKLLENIDNGVKRVKNAYAYITLEDNYLPRAAAISTGGLIGLLMARRGGVIKRVFYTSLGLTAMASVCYPKQAVMISEDLLKIGKYYAIVAYQKIQEADRRRKNPSELKKPSDWAKAVGVAKPAMTRVVKIVEVEDDEDEDDEEDEDEEEEEVEEEKGKDVKPKVVVKKPTKPVVKVAGKIAKPVVELSIGPKDMTESAVLLATGVKEKKFTAKADEGKEKEEVKKSVTSSGGKEKDDKKKEKIEDKKGKDEDVKMGDTVTLPVESLKDGVKGFVTIVNEEEGKNDKKTDGVFPELPAPSVDEQNIWLAETKIEKPEKIEEKGELGVEKVEKSGEKKGVKSGKGDEKSGKKEEKVDTKPEDSGDAGSTPKDAFKILEDVIDAEKMADAIKPLEKFTISANEAAPDDSSNADETSKPEKSPGKVLKTVSDAPPVVYKRIKVRTRRPRGEDSSVTEGDAEKEKEKKGKMRKVLLHREKKAARNWSFFDSDDENERPRIKKHRQSLYPKNTLSNIDEVDSPKRPRSKVADLKTEKPNKEDVTAVVSGIAASGASLMEPDIAPSPFESDTMYKLGRNIAKKKLVTSAKSKITSGKKSIVFDDDDEDVLGDVGKEEKKPVEPSTKKTETEPAKVEEQPAKVEEQPAKVEEEPVKIVEPPPPPPFTFREESKSEGAETPLFELARQEHLYSLPKTLPKEFEIVGEMDSSSPIWTGLSGISAAEDATQESQKLNQFIHGLNTHGAAHFDANVTPVWIHPVKDENLEHSKKEGIVNPTFTMGGSPVAPAPHDQEFRGNVAEPKSTAAAHDSSKLSFAGVQAMKEVDDPDFKQDYDEYDYDDAEDYDYVVVSDQKEVFRPMSKSSVGEVPLTPAL